MTNKRDFWSDYGIPFVVTIGATCAINYLWNQPQLALYDRLEPVVFLAGNSMIVYMICGSFVGLWFLWRAMRRDVLGPYEAGLSPDGWKPWKRWLGLFLILFLAYGGLKTLPNAVRPPSLDDYAFWFVFLLPATTAELLAFLSIGFCLPEKWLRDEIGMHPVAATVIAIIFSGVIFGLYHYTHPPPWDQYVFNLMPVMWINLSYFALSRNFHMTFILHNAFAAVGFTGEQYLKETPEPYMNPANYEVAHVALLVTAALVPYLLLTWLETKYWDEKPLTK